MDIIHFTNSINRITLTTTTYPTINSISEVIIMKSYQGLFAQALYLAAMPLNSEESSKAKANTNEQECIVEDSTN